MGNQPEEPVAWATVDPVPETGRVWAALSELHPRTGLVPIQLDGLRSGSLFPRDRQGLPGDALRPWDNGEFSRPQDPREADGLDAGEVLGDRWRSWVPGTDSDCPEDRAARGPFTLEWPGLAAPERTPLTSAERQRALDVVLPRIRQAHRATPAARVGLVAAGRPADVLAVIGWDGLANYGEEALLPLTAVLRSWEDRFGARLIDVGYADLRLLVDRPPRTLQAAQRIAAEQVVLADDCIDGMRDIPHIAARLVSAPSGPSGGTDPAGTWCWTTPFTSTTTSPPPGTERGFRGPVGGKHKRAGSGRGRPSRAEGQPGWLAWDPAGPAYLEV